MTSQENIIDVTLLPFVKEEGGRRQDCSSLPAERCQMAPAAGWAAPGRVSACAGEAASLCSPGPKLAPAQPAGKLRTPAAPPRSPHPGQGANRHSHN